MSDSAMPAGAIRQSIGARLREVAAFLGGRSGGADRGLPGRLDRVLRIASNLAAVLGGCILALMLGIACAGIIMRGLGGDLRGAVEIGGCLCALAVGLCLPAAQYGGSHIEVGVMADRLPRSVQAAMRPLSRLACAGVLLLAALELRELAAYTQDIGETIEGFSFSSAPMTLGLALGAALQAAIFLLELLRTMLPAAPAAATGERGAA